MEMKPSVVNEVVKVQNLKAGDSIIVSIAGVEVYNAEVPIGKRVIGGAVIVSIPLSDEVKK